MAARVLILWCPDWPVTAALAERAERGAVIERSAAVIDAANHVLACSPAAQEAGIRAGMRRRDAQARQPELLVLADDPDRDARLFEPVAQAVEDLAPGVEIIRPGLLAVPAKGPAGYFGGEAAAAEHLLDHLAGRTGAEAQIGVADQLATAIIAARRGHLVEPGTDAAYLAPLPTAVLTTDQDSGRADPDRIALVDLLRRLGIRDLGAFAALSERDIATRFGPAAILAHRIARGVSTRPLDRRTPPPDLSVEHRFDPVADRVDTAAFAARTLAERFVERLAGHGLGCVRVGIHAVTDTGHEHHRAWRSAEPATAHGIATRVRWQLDGWLHRAREDPEATGIARLRLEPEEIITGAALQPTLTHDPDTAAAAERADRISQRLQALLGPDRVLSPIPNGGRSLTDRVHLVPWGDNPTPRRDPDQPWPGHLPPPYPATLPSTAVPARLHSPTGAEIGVTGRYHLTGRPTLLMVHNGPTCPVTDWAGPWPIEQRHWQPDAQRLAYLQIIIEPRQALLLIRTNGRWLIAGAYD